MQATKGKNTGFRVVNHWINMNRIAKGLPVERVPKATPQSKLRFNSALVCVKSKYGWGSQDIVWLIDYMFFHDPLRLGHPKAYGTVGHVVGSASYFAQWRKKNAAEIEKYGMDFWIVGGRPKHAFVEHEEFLTAASSLKEDLDIEELI